MGTFRRALVGLAVAAAGLAVPIVVRPVAPAGAVPVTFSYTGPAVPIPDLGSGTATLAVSGLANSIDDLDFRIDGSACTATEGATTVGIDHGFVGDLYLRLTSPSGTTVIVVAQASLDGGANLCQVRLDDDAGEPGLQDAQPTDAPYTGTWSPAQPLSWFDGEDPNGTWTLVAEDVSAEDSGNLRAFSLIIDASPLVLPTGEFRYRGPAVPIPDFSASVVGSVEVPLTVSGLAGDIDDIDFRIDGTECTQELGATTVGIDHVDTTDLKLFLTSPDGTTVGLISRIPVLSHGINFCQLTLDDAATQSVQSNTNPLELVDATWRPWEALSQFNGEQPNGTWRLRVESHASSFRPANVRKFSLHIDAPFDPLPSGLAWETSPGITYGTALSDAQLDATADVPGTYVYTPPSGTVLGAGIHELSVTFTPNDPTYRTETATTSIIVDQAPSGLTWDTPAAITYGTALSGTQLNATASPSVPGTFVYTPPSGTVLDAGIHTLSVTFTPTSSNYEIETKTVLLAVGSAPSAVTWPAPAAVTYGTPLSEVQLNATAGVDGDFVYTPAAGTILPVGTHSLSVTFTPTSSNYAAATAVAPIMVTKATTALTITQLPSGTGQLAARLTAGGSPVAGQTVTFTLASTTPSGASTFLCSAVTGADGVARCSVTGLLALTLSMPGSSALYRFTATYTGSGSYLPATDTAGGAPPPPPPGRTR